jgi:hypothetical protein
MGSYYTVPGVDTGVRSTANSADVRGNLLLRLAIGGEAGILVEEDVSPDVGPHFIAIYFPSDDLGALIRHLQAMQAEYEALKESGAWH